jgi:hypothetical protein
VAHHGLQRSGTNYLNESLWKCGIKPINSFDQQRASTRHKHFRWYSDKSIIPHFLRDLYDNTNVVDSLEQLNDLARYPKNTLHLVIQKERVSWLASILNWGLKCNWFSDKEIALSSLLILLGDYEHYYSFWSDLADKHPNQVVIIQFEQLLSDFSVLHRLVGERGVELRCGCYSGIIREVPKSRVGRKGIIRVPEVREALMDALK